jgi:hypothetical protein
MAKADEQKRAAVNAKNAAYRAAHPGKVQEWNRRYRENNPDRVRQSQREYAKRRYWSDPEYRLVKQLRSRLSKAVGRGSSVSAAIAQCGCSASELLQKLEAQFEPGMSWEKRSEWHIDHIYPLKAIDPSNRRHVIAVNNWRNLRPAWASENRSKRDSVSEEAAALFGLILETITPEESVCDPEV